MRQLQTPQLLSLLLLIGFCSCGTLNTALLSSPKKTGAPSSEPTVTVEPTVATTEPTKTKLPVRCSKPPKPKSDEVEVARTTEPTVTVEPTKATEPIVTGGPSTTGFPSSTTLKTTTAKPTPPPLNFEDELIASQTPIEPMLPTANCKVKPLVNSSLLFEEVVVPPILKTISSSDSFPDSGILSEIKKNSLHTHREKIFVRIPSEECPPEIVRKTIVAFDNLRDCQSLPSMSYSNSLAAEAKDWAAKTASRGVVYKPNYGSAGQYATSTSAPYALFSLDLSKFDVMAKWREAGGNNYLPWYTGDGSSRHFSNYEWKQVREFGVGCAAYRFKEAKVIFWTVVFFKKQ